jgi:predicted nicotinamide N-methyase
LTDRSFTNQYGRFVRENTVPAQAPLVPEITLHLASEVTPLWHATEETMAQNGLPPPYWAFAWPGGQTFARLLLDRPELARGRKVLDFASGCGIAAIAAAKSGAARIIATEIDSFAVAALNLNAALNAVTFEIMEGDVLAEPPAAWDLILAGDVCYERPLATALSSRLVEIARHDVPTSLDLENRKIMTTVIYRYAPSGL